MSLSIFGEIHKEENYRDVVADLIQSYKAAGCSMSIKVRFLDSHLDCFPENPRTVSDQHGKPFHQDIFTMERRYQGKWSQRMQADYCWTLRRDFPQAKYNGNSSTVTFWRFIYP
jgi:hypothetical protein